MHGTSQAAGMILVWPVPISAWQERGFLESPRPSQGANVMLSAQQTRPGGSPAPCPVTIPRGGYSWKENDELWSSGCWEETGASGQVAQMQPG